MITSKRLIPHLYTRESRGWGVGSVPATYICKFAPSVFREEQLNGSYSSGEFESKDPLAPHKGNRINALPYWNEVLEIGEPTGTFTRVRYLKNIGPISHKHLNVCDGGTNMQTDTWSYPPGSFKFPLTYQTSLPHFTAAEEHFAKKVAETKAVNKLRRGVASLPMMWFERAATIRNARERLLQIADIAVKRQKADLAGYRKIKGKNAKKRFARKVASDHLEMIFGWAPLLKDIEGLVEYINEPSRDFVRANGKHSIVRHSKTNGKVAGSTGPQFYYVQKTTESIGYRCALRATVTSVLSNNFRQLGFQPVYSLYDAAPLSFVLGWVSNFGSWIGTFDPLYGVEFTTGSTNRKLHRTTEVQAFGSEAYHYVTPTAITYDRTTGGGKQFVTQMRNDRTVLTAEPDREFFLMNNLSIYSVLASLSLVVQKKLKIAKPVFDNSPFILKRTRRKPKTLPPIEYRK